MIWEDEEAVRCQVLWQWQCKRTKPGAGRRKDRERPSDKGQTGHSKGFWDDDNTEAGPRCY